MPSRLTNSRRIRHSITGLFLRKRTRLRNKRYGTLNLRKSRKLKSLTEKEIRLSMVKFYKRLKPLVQQWRMQPEGERKTAIMLRLQKEIAERQRMSQKRIATTFPLFERSILDTVFTLFDTKCTAADRKKVTARLVDMVKSKGKITDDAIAKAETLTLINNLTTKTDQIERLGGKQASWFVRTFPNAFAGNENIFVTGITGYLSLCAIDFM